VLLRASAKRDVRGKLLDVLNGPSSDFRVTAGVGHLTSLHVCALRV